MNEIGRLIAVLDDEPQMCKALSRLLKTHGFRVVTFVRGADLLSSCESQLPDCLLLDLHMPDLNGFKLLEQFAASRVPLPVIVITGQDQPGTAERVHELGAVEYLLKPLNESLLIAAIDKAIELRASSHEQE